MRTRADVLWIVARAAGAFALAAALGCGPASPAQPALRAAPRAVPAAGPPAAPSCARGVARLLSTLKRPVEIDAYVARGSPELDRFVGDLDKLLGELAGASGGNLKHRVIEPRSPEEREAALRAGLLEASFGGGTENGVPVVLRGFLGVVFRYGGEQQVIPALLPDSGEGMPFWLMTKIRELAAEVDGRGTRFGVIAGKSEIRITDENLIAVDPKRPGSGPSMKGLLNQAVPFYRINEVDLRAGQAAVAPEIVGLFITQPGADYTDEELRRIDEFLMRGGKSVAVFAGAVNLEPSNPAMKARLDTRRLERLLDAYGVEMRREAVLDWEQSISVPVEARGGRMVSLRAPWIVQARAEPDPAGGGPLLDPTFAPFFRIGELAMPFPSTLVAHPERQPGARVRVVARTTRKSTGDASPVSSMKIVDMPKPTGEFGQRAMAIVVEGDITSAFSRGTHARGRVLVLSASQFLANPFARAGNPPPPDLSRRGGGGDEDLMMLSQPYAQKYLTGTVIAFKNTLDWMSLDDDVVACTMAGPKL